MTKYLSLNHSIILQLSPLKSSSVFISYRMAEFPLILIKYGSIYSCEQCSRSLPPLQHLYIWINTSSVL